MARQLLNAFTHVVSLLIGGFTITDILTKERRSELMSRVRSKETKPERIVRRFLFSQGFRYRLHDKRYPGTPDLVLPKYKTFVLIHGCFWHGHENCRAAGLPESNREFWESKLTRNKERDLAVLGELEQSGWQVITVWECEIKSVRKRVIRLERLIGEIQGTLDTEKLSI